MDVEQKEPDDSTEPEEDADAWNFPQSPLTLAVPPQEFWPERDAAFEEGLGGMDGSPAAA